MIYEYPKEFIVPVVYANDLKDTDIYRCNRTKDFHEGELLISDKELQANEIFSGQVDVSQENHNEYIFKDSKFQDNSVYVNIKDIMNDIDEDYANSET